MWSTGEARRIHSIVMYYLECPPGLQFLSSEIEHPLIASNDFPAPLNQCDGSTIQIKRQTILTYLRIIGGAAERAHPRQRYDCPKRQRRSVIWHGVLWFSSIFRTTGSYKAAYARS